MTHEELSKLTPEQKRVKIAKACGTIKWSTALPTWQIHCDVPDYINDSNAMREAISTLSKDPPGEEQYSAYTKFCIQLERICGALPYDATDAQRADAFLLTL